MRSYLLALALISCLCSCQAPEETASNATDATEAEATVEKPTIALQDIDSDEALVATALMAAPEESRAECTVIGYNMAGEFVTFREGTNDLICLTDDPKRDGFNAACYHKSLEPFMARGRALRAEGKNRQEIFDAREEEVKSGALSMGDEGTTLHIYYGKENQYDPETSKVEGAVYRYVVYLPFATAASTGLPEAPIAPNHPWIMDPGTHKAHIMISPINDFEE